MNYHFEKLAKCVFIPWLLDCCKEIQIGSEGEAVGNKNLGVHSVNETNKIGIKRIFVKNEDNTISMRMFRGEGWKVTFGSKNISLHINLLRILYPF